MTQNEIKEGFLDIVKAELAFYGIESSKVSINNRELIEIDDHFLENQVLFMEKAQWPHSNIKIRAYTVDNGKIIFRPDNNFEDQYRENDQLRSILHVQIEEVNQKIKELNEQYLKQLSEFVLDKTLDERLIPELIENYQLTYSLADVLNWKVKIILNNSVSFDENDKKLKKGDMDSVGYVMIGLKTGTLIPIARADEHHKGYDLIYHLVNKGYIPDDSYYAIFSSHTYVNSNDTEALLALKTWRKLGGQNLIIKSETNDINFQMSIDDYIKKEGKIEINKGELFPLGAELIKKLKTVSSLCIESRKDSRKEKRLYAEVLSLYNFYLQKIEVHYSENDEILKNIYLAESIGGEEGIKKIEQYIFGFEGFKNKIHNNVREAINAKNKNSYSFKIRTMESIFGDLDLANHELGSL